MPDLVGTQHFCSESVFKIQNLHFLTNYYNISKILSFIFYKTKNQPPFLFLLDRQ